MVSKLRGFLARPSTVALGTPFSALHLFSFIPTSYTTVPWTSSLSSPPRRLEDDVLDCLYPRLISTIGKKNSPYVSLKLSERKYSWQIVLFIALFLKTVRACQHGILVACRGMSEHWGQSRRMLGKGCGLNKGDQIPGLSFLSISRPAFATQEAFGTLLIVISFPSVLLLKKKIAISILVLSTKAIMDNFLAT